MQACEHILICMLGSEIEMKKKHHPQGSCVLKNGTSMRDQGLEPWTP